MTTSLLFLPGTLCDCRAWRPVADALRIDCKNTTPHYFVEYAAISSIGEMAERALTYASGTVIPIGLSMGGAVALEMWRQAPHRIASMVLCGTDASADTPARYAMRAEQFSIAMHEGLAAMLATVMDKYFVADSEDKLSALQRCAYGMAQQQGLPALIAQHRALTHRRDNWPWLSAMTAPTLILCGEVDTICPPEIHARMALCLPNSRYEIISKAAHLAPLQQPSQVAAYIAQWLAASDLAR